MIDISKKITNELPVIKISENLIVSVNNRKSNVLTVQAMIAESEKREVLKTTKGIISKIENMNVFFL